MMNRETAAAGIFVIRASSLIRHSTLVIRHSPASQD
jgi:hypothetical protein